MANLQRNQWIGGTLKSANRLRQIVAVFAKHGFQNIVEELELGKYFFLEKFSSSNMEQSFTTAERLRMALESLGPTWIKFGQMLASRPDLVPEAFMSELKKLQAQVPAMPFETVQRILDEEYDRPVSEIYREIERTPIGAASIAQVHKASLHTGEEVVLKVQRPNLEDAINEDLQVLYTLSLLLEKYRPELRVLNLSSMVEEFASAIEQELDFYIEANNMDRFRKNFFDDPHIVIPKVYHDLSTSKILVQEELKGKNLNAPDAFKQKGIYPHDVIQIGIRAFFKMIFKDGVFHADLHEGNIFVLPDQQIGLIDFGMIGYLSQKSRDSIAGIMMSIADEDYEQLAFEFLELSPYSYDCDIDAFTHEIQGLFAPYHGLSFANFQIGKLLLDATRVAGKHGISLPSDLMLLFKSILTVEGMGRSLGEDFDLLSFSNEFAIEVIKSKYNFGRLSKNLGMITKDSAALIAGLPRHARQALRKLNSPNFHWKLQVEEMHDLKRGIEKGSNIIFLGLVISSMLISATGAMFIPNSTLIGGIPAISAILYGLATFTGFVAVYNYIRK
ncbi:MAG: AarF/ABC1/UbiB kinase family protein [Bdellovibrionota bacterium]|nr:AarF/ABC1/UbiB kinase family protein [Bdellovibrionota bacterium]